VGQDHVRRLPVEGTVTAVRVREDIMARSGLYDVCWFSALVKRYPMFVM
jgi:hypothetical protein